MRPLPSTVSQEKPQVRLEVQNGTCENLLLRDAEGARSGMSASTGRRLDLARENPLCFPNPVPGASARPVPGPPGRVWWVWDRVPVHSRPAGLYSAGLGHFPVARWHLIPGRQPEPGARVWTPRGTLRAVAPSRSAAGAWGRGPWQTESGSRGVRGRGQKRGLLTGMPGAWCRPRGENSSHLVDGCAGVQIRSQ